MIPVSDVLAKERQGGAPWISLKKEGRPGIIISPVELPVDLIDLFARLEQREIVNVGWDHNENIG